MRKLSFVIAGFLVAFPWALGQAQPDHSMMGGAAKTTETTPLKQITPLKQTTCPVTGKMIRADVFVEQDGLKVYFSSPESAAKFKESPTSYLPAVYKQIYLQTVQVKCPVSGDPVDPNKLADFIGSRIYFCCDMCPKDFKADPAKYLAKMKTVSTDQMHCPVTGTAIDPRVSTQYQGKTVYFSSKDASAKFKANPSKYAAALRPEGGVLARGAIAKDDLVLTAVAPPEKAVRSRKDTESTAYRGRTYFAGSEDDMKEFEADPAKYAAAINDKVKTKKADSPQWFTCGMDPDVLQKGPGKCPKCGMDLTSVKSTGAKSEHADHGMMQGQQGGGRGGMMQGQQGGGHGGQDQQNGGHPGCAPLGHEH